MIVVTSFTEPGGHADNEDAFLVERHPAGPDRWICILADGQGGQAGGAEAAQIACRTAMAAALRRPVHALRDPDAWTEILGEADAAVAGDPIAGYTTLIGFLITLEFVVGASCGDSAVMMLEHETETPARDLTGGQRKDRPVGSGGAMFVPFSAGLAGPWSVVAMSDGVWKYAGWEHLVQALRKSRSVAVVEALEQRVRSPRTDALPDDFTLVLFENDD